jgi:valyl-tRNA synthetase
VWYCPNGHQFAALEDPKGCPECGSKDIEQDPDVLDTWFSSQLWPFSTLGWPERTDDLEFFYPTSVLVTGYEILYLWVTRMAMSGLLFMKEVPFREVVITGLVRDRFGKPMHKSSGNVVDPLDLIAKYGADSVRFGLLWMATGGQDMPLAEETIEAAKRFANKIWNAGRFVLSMLDDEGPSELPSESLWTLTDRWLLSRHQACLAEVDHALGEFRFAEAAQALHRFFWAELCDWALEAAKPRLYDGADEDRRAASGVLAWVLERSLRMLHPVMPFVTEEVWQRFGAGESIMVASWPEQHEEHLAPSAESEFNVVMGVVTAIRQWRKTRGLRDRMILAGVRMHPTGPQETRAILELRQEIDRLAGVVIEEILDEAPSEEGLVAVTSSGVTSYLPVAFKLDEREERSALIKKLRDVEARMSGSQQKLSNSEFLAKAPSEVVEKERARLSSLQEEAATLAARLHGID